MVCAFPANIDRERIDMIHGWSAPVVKTATNVSRNPKPTIMVLIIYFDYWAR